MEASLWSKMGKPDFATCGQIFYRLPADLREGLNRSDERTLVWIIFLQWFSAFHSGRGVSSVYASQSTIGEKFGRSRWTVIRALARLEDCGLIRVIRRRPTAAGDWQTNLYQPGVRLYAFVSRLVAKSANLLGVAKVPQKNSDKESISWKTTPPLGRRLPEKEEFHLEEPDGSRLAAIDAILKPRRDRESAQAS